MVKDLLGAATLINTEIAMHWVADELENIEVTDERIRTTSTIQKTVKECFTVPNNITEEFQDNKWFCVSLAHGKEMRPTRQMYYQALKEAIERAKRVQAYRSQ